MQGPYLRVWGQQNFLDVAVDQFAEQGHHRAHRPFGSGKWVLVLRATILLPLLGFARPHFGGASRIFHGDTRPLAKSFEHDLSADFGVVAKTLATTHFATHAKSN